jgi:hypothetical protein
VGGWYPALRAPLRYGRVVKFVVTLPGGRD